MSDICENCPEIKKLEFQIEGLGLVVQKNRVSLDAVTQSQLSKDIEHEQMIQNVTNRMDTMSQDLIEFKKEVKADIQEVRADMKKDIQSIKNDIPAMFDNAVNKLLAKMFKWVIGILLVIIGVIALAITRPVLVKGVDEVKHWIETVEITK